MARRSVSSRESRESIVCEQLLLRRAALLRMLGAVVIVLWDLLARRRGLPLRHVLGRSQDRILARAGGGSTPGGSRIMMATVLSAK
jgi:L-alanine-DL-glutamate epimerase-like enolase superfamily enzyme